MPEATAAPKTAAAASLASGARIRVAAAATMAAIETAACGHETDGVGFSAMADSPSRQLDEGHCEGAGDE
ncbi:MAG: hypothetical protein V3W44_09630 [Dehalococcoidales bacterium]